MSRAQAIIEALHEYAFYDWHVIGSVLLMTHGSPSDEDNTPAPDPWMTPWTRWKWVAEPERIVRLAKGRPMLLVGRDQRSSMHHRTMTVQLMIALGSDEEGIEGINQTHRLTEADHVYARLKVENEVQLRTIVRHGGKAFPRKGRTPGSEYFHKDGEDRATYWTRQMTQAQAPDWTRKRDGD